MRVAVVGGGIAGLAVALACALRGLEVSVHEQAPGLEEVGAGLQISPNGWRVLEALGVARALEPHVFEPPTLEMRLGQSGHRVWSLKMGETARARWGAPFVQVHRAALVEVLAARLQTLASGTLHLGARVEGYETGALQVGGDAYPADVIVGADGLHSVIRTQMLGEDQPSYTGNLAWRALVPMDDLGPDAPPANGTVWVGKGRHVVTTRIDAGRVVNFVGMVEKPEPGPEGWRIEGTREDVRADFEGWAGPVMRVIEAAPRFHRWALFSRAPLPRWSDDTAILIGDAAHPMLPSFAQGAVQALEDAWVLAALVASNAPKMAGRLLHEQRIARTAKIQAQSAGNARMFHRAGLLGTPVYYGGMAVVAACAPGILRARQDPVYAEDVVAAYPMR